MKGVTRIALLAQGPIATACLAELFAPSVDVEVPLLVCDDMVHERASMYRGAHEHSLRRLEVGQRCDEQLLALVPALGVTDIISIQYPWILPREVLDCVAGKAFNLHNAKLPDYRGYNALSHEILNREDEHVVTLHWMHEEVDTGWIAFTDRCAIRPHETAYSLHQASIPLAAALIGRLVDSLDKRIEIPREPITGRGTFYSRNSITPLKRIPDSSCPEAIDRIARAFHFPPHEPAYFEHANRRTHVTPA